MSTASDRGPDHAYETPPPSPLARALGALLVLAGVVAMAGLIAAVVTNPDVRAGFDASLGPDRPSWVLAILDRFGLIVPLLVLTLGATTISAGVRVARRDAATLRMTRDASAWGVFFLGVVAIARVIQGVALWPDAPSAWGSIMAGVAGPAAAALVTATLRIGLARAAEAPDLPHEPLPAREARSAWNLLIPALLILIMVAARPLEATVITSVTDKRFASDQVPRFVGLSHYRELLTVRLDDLECRRDDAGSCLVDANGKVRWDALPRERLVEGYRTAWTWNLPFLTDDDSAISVSALDRIWIRSIWVTIVFTVSSVSLELVLGLFIAMTVHSSFRGRGAMRAVMLVPWAIPTVVSARLWELMLKDTSAGVLNRALMSVGLLDTPQAWLTTSVLQLPSVVMIDVWKTSPFMALLLLAGLQVIPKELYESARVDGASPIREFFAITLPLLKPAIGVALIFRTLDALRVFDLFQVLFGRSSHSVSTYNFEVLINN